MVAMWSRSASTGPANAITRSTGICATAATASGLSPDRMRAWMSRGRRALSIVISNWPRRARSPRTAARSRSSIPTATSSPVSATARMTFVPSGLSPTSFASRIAVCSPVRLPTSLPWVTSQTKEATPSPVNCSRYLARVEQEAVLPVVQVVLDLTGIFVFAITGALVGVRKQLDWFGVQVLAMATGFATLFWHPGIGRVERMINVFDAAGLGLFCVTGTLKALAYGLGPAPAVVLGTVTGVGGGVLRDVLS